jgi:hypothetical protein
VITVKHLWISPPGAKFLGRAMQASGDLPLFSETLHGAMIPLGCSQTCIDDGEKIEGWKQGSLLVA